MPNRHGHQGPPPHYGYYPPPTEPDYSRVEVLPNEVPGRVQAAVHVLGMFTAKTAKVIYHKGDAHGGGQDYVDGQELTVHEEEVRETACSFLAAYFAGEVDSDQWETVRLRGAIVNLGPEAHILPPGGKHVVCELCKLRGKVSNKCAKCEGAGGMMVYPVPTRISQESDEGG